MPALAVCREGEAEPGRGSPGTRRSGPRLRAADDPQPVDMRGGGGSARPRVLVVDDEFSMRLICRVNLDLGGFDVVEAADGAAALSAAATADFALVMLDVMMPDMSGHEIAQRLRQSVRTRDVPIVFFSARASRDDLRTGFELGAIDYITKPFDAVALAPRVERVLELVQRGEAEQFRQAKLSELSQ